MFVLGGLYCLLFVNTFTLKFAEYINLKILWIFIKSTKNLVFVSSRKLLDNLELECATNIIYLNTYYKFSNVKLFMILLSSL